MEPRNTRQVTRIKTYIMRKMTPIPHPNKSLSYTLIRSYQRERIIDLVERFQEHEQEVAAMDEWAAVL